MRTATSRHVLASFAVCIGALAALVFRVSAVTSTSMSPTIRPDDHVLLLRSVAMRLSPRLSTVERGDVVVLRGPRGEIDLLKRVVAVAGDRIRITEGLLFLNGSPVREPYAHHANAGLRQGDEWPMAGTAQEVVIPAGTAFVLGDNRSESSDSRIWGPVPISSIVAKVVTRLP